MKKINKLLVTSFASLALFIPITYAYTKEETVYTKLKPNGSIKKTLVNEHLSGLNGDTKDVSNLKDILNINSDKPFTQEGNKITWKGVEKDLYYQGKTSKELPVKTSITYKLNGKQKKIGKILGKKGRVEIIINYNNNTCNDDICTPFVVTLGTIIPTKNNTNIEVTNGKIINNGTNNLVIAIASPSLDKSLGVEELSSLNQIIISYDTDKFELSTMYTVMTSKLIGDDDLEIFNKMDGLYDEIETFSSSSKQLMSGSKNVLNGVNVLKTGSEQVNIGSSKLNAGSKELSKSTNQVVNKVESIIDLMKNDNTSTLDDKTLSTIKEMAQNNAILSSEIQNQIATQAVLSIRNSEQYKKFLSSIDELKVNQELVENKIDEVNLLMSQTSDKNSDEYKALEMNLQTLNTSLNTITSGIESYQNMMILMEETAKNVSISVASKVAIQTAGTTAEEVSKIVASSAKEKFTLQSTEMLEQLVQGLKQINNGAKSLSDGMSNLYHGTQSLEKGSNELKNGVQSLSNGMVKFDKEGVNAISSLVNNKIKPIVSKTKNLIKLGNDYDTFTLKDEGVKGTTKFITIIDGKSK